MLLYNDEADYTSVYNIFKSDITEDGEIYDDKKLNNLIQVVINKYTNALKVFGVKIRKEHNKYKLDSSLYSVDYSMNDLKALSIILSVSENIPDEEINKNITDLKSNLILRMDSTDKNTFTTLNTNKDFSFFYADIKDQIKTCKNYCKDNIILDMIYLHKNKELRIMCKPKEVSYNVKTAYLHVFDTNKKENLEIALPNILSMKVMPNRTALKLESTTTIAYKLKGRLAKTYKLKEGERLSNKTDNELYIINNGEPRDKLYARLMRYADLCEIISPKYIRNEMIDLLNETIKLYEE